ncbi:MAG: LysM peptidoglycan-binding domain-containing protein [Anaerolineales bacterium]|nr:LysM peptidoglycan-binding domain-containing protein [Anaerolineales bacterium]
MTQENSSNKTKVCPTCGTRLSENAARCLVCGTEFASKKPELKLTKKAAEKPLQASRMPEIRLSLPAAVGILAAVIAVVAIVVVFAFRRGGGETANNPLAPEESLTPTSTPTETLQPTNTLPATDTPTFTPQPPIEYTVREGDGSCSQIAFTFQVSVQSIIILNNLASSCPISVGQVLKIPFPTPTIPPPPTNTPLAADATKQACETVPVTVQDGDTLSSISLNYAVPAQAIKDWNGLTTDNVFFGTTLQIPLCMRAATPGPTPTATIPPPYPAPNLLLPADGAAFSLANDVITLQWASVGALRTGEAYQIVVEDLTADQTRRLTDYVTDTKYIVPITFRPKDNVAHILRWWVVPVRQEGSDDQGQPIWTNSGAASVKRVFTWVGIAIESTPTP